jgi:hypothetical protein
MKNSSDTIGNRTRDLPTCSAVPQSTALPGAAETYKAAKNIWNISNLGAIIVVRHIQLYVIYRHI